MIRALYQYNEWANDHVLAVASGLSESEFRGNQGASFESVEGNLAHIVAGQSVWWARWTEGENPQSLGESIRGFEAIRKSFERSHRELREYLSSLTEADLERVLSYTDNRGNPQARVLWQLLAHLVNHGTHHRAETAMALTAMGHAPGELGYQFFEVERG
jgi:uncharacterized damage-inducible protein DinB